VPLRRWCDENRNCRLAVDRLRKLARLQPSSMLVVKYTSFGLLQRLSNSNHLKDNKCEQIRQESVTRLAE
jgi:hypothetical protein